MYLTIEELKTYNIVAFEGKTNGDLEVLIALYSGMVEEYCNTKFKETEHHFKVDVASKVPVMCTPLLKVKEVTYKQIPLQEDEQYYVYEDRNFIELQDTNTFTQRKKALGIYYTYGFKEVPTSVKKVIIDLMKLHVEGSNSNSMISQESFDSEYSYTKNTQKTTEQLQQDILLSLNRYKQQPYKPIEDSEGNVRARLI